MALLVAEPTDSAAGTASGSLRNQTSITQAGSYIASDSGVLRLGLLNLKLLLVLCAIFSTVVVELVVALVSQFQLEVQASTSPMPAGRVTDAVAVVRGQPGRGHASTLTSSGHVQYMRREPLLGSAAMPQIFVAESGKEYL